MPRAHANGIEIEYEEFGDAADEPMLLIMGLAAQLVLWDEAFCTALAERGYRVIRFDNRDVGLSTKFDHLGMPNLLAVMSARMLGQSVAAPYLLSDMAADAAGLLDALDVDAAHVVGASMGGMIAQTMAIEHPARVRSLTSIMSTTGDPSLPPPTPEAGPFCCRPRPTIASKRSSERYGSSERSAAPAFPSTRRAFVATRRAPTTAASIPRGPRGS